MTAGGRGGRARRRRRRPGASGAPGISEQPAEYPPPGPPPTDHPLRLRATGRIRHVPGHWFDDSPDAGARGEEPPPASFQGPPSGPFRAPSSGPFPQPPAAAFQEPPPAMHHEPPPAPFGEPPGPPGPPPGGPEEPAAGRRLAAKRAKRRRSSWFPWASWSSRLSALREEWGLSERQQRVVVGVTVGVVVLAIALVLTLTVERLAELSEPPRAAAGEGLTIDLPRPDDYQAWTSLPQFAAIADRKNDPKPVTAQEIFPAKTVRAGRITLRLVERREDKDCAAVLWGNELIAGLGDTGCTQAVRGLYRSADGRYVAQYTLFNMSGVEAADGFVKLLTTQHRGGWVRPLDSKAAVFPAGGYTEASGHAMGHFAGLVWVGRSDGAEPTARDDFVGLSLAVRGAEKAVFARVVAAGGKSGTSK
jgi:U5 snRNP spliceosome subunit